MMCVETIKIQAANAQAASLKKKLTMFVRSFNSHSDCQGITRLTFCEHGTLPGHFALHLWWQSGTLPAQGSRLGLSLMQTLQAFGLVDHAVWIEQEEQGI